MIAIVSTNRPPVVRLRSPCRAISDVTQADMVSEVEPSGRQASHEHLGTLSSSSPLGRDGVGIIPPPVSPLPLTRCA